MMYVNFSIIFLVYLILILFKLVQGAILAKIEFDNDKIEFEDPNLRNLISEVSTKVISNFKFILNEKKKLNF